LPLQFEQRWTSPAERVWDVVTQAHGLVPIVVRFTETVDPNQLEHAVVSLQTIRGQLVRISVAGEESRQADAADRVRDVREELAAVADGMREAYARMDAAPETPA